MSNNYDACILEYKIHAEYQLLTKHLIQNLYVIPSANSSFIWYGVLFIHHGIYEGGVFRFTLFIPDNFDCPRVIFNPSVYHPMINSDTGELDIKQYISNWKYETNFDVFKKHVRHCIDEANKRLYDDPPKNADDPHAIKFSHLDEHGLSEIKREMQEFNKKPVSGISNSSKLRKD